MPQFCSFQLGNGLRTYAVHRPHARSFVISLAFRAGSFDDPPNLPGLAHFAEHMAFEGPNKRLALELTQSGAYLNARTMHQHTEFVFWGHVEQLNLALEFIANLFKVPPIEDSELRRERNVLYHEYIGAGIEGRRAAADAFHRRVLGDRGWQRQQPKYYVRCLKNITADRLEEFRRRFYIPASARLAVESPLKAQELKSSLERCFNDDSPVAEQDNAADCPRPVTVPPVIYADRYSYAWVNITQAINCTDVCTRLSASLISRLLGGGPHSIMYQHLRSDRGLAYDARAEAGTHLHGTEISLRCSVPHTAMNETFDFLVAMLDKAGERGITDQQLDEEKTRARRWRELSDDNPFQMASYISYEGLRPESESLADPQSFMSALATLTTAEVNDRIGQLLSRQNRSIFVASQIWPLKRFFFLRRMKKALRPPRKII